MNESNTQNLVKYSLSTEVIERLRGRFPFPDKDVRPAIQKALNLSADSVNRLIRENQPNGKLTTAAVVNIIAEQLCMNSSEVLIEILEPCSLEA